MIVDANVLICATNTSVAQHPVAKEWLTNALNGSERVGLPWVSLTAFVRINTNPRINARPMTPAEAWGFVTEWLDNPQTWIPSPGHVHSDILGALLIDFNVTGGLVTDAHLAALAIEHGTSVCSFDSDFAKFPQLRWINPLG